MACGSLQQPFKADLGLLNRLHEKLKESGLYGQAVEEGLVSVTTLAGQACLVVDVQQEQHFCRSIFAYVSAGHALGLDLLARMDDQGDHSLRIDLEGSLAHLETERDKQHKFAFSGGIKATDVNDDKTYNVALNFPGLPPDLFPINFNWHLLLACAPTCFTCRKDLVCWFSCAAGCVVQCM
jgi:hypothetical protein